MQLAVNRKNKQPQKKLHTTSEDKLKILLRLEKYNETIEKN
jgi:hypothetical protein